MSEHSDRPEDLRAVHTADQVDGAGAQIRQGIDAAREYVEATGPGSAYQEGTAIAGPIGARYGDWESALFDPKRRQFCPHMGTPTAATGFLALPGVLACLRAECQSVLAARYHFEVPDNVCDACSRIVLDNRFSEMNMAVGPFQVSANICGDCRADQ
jgi:hypothetical protein